MPELTEAGLDGNMVTAPKSTVFEQFIHCFIHFYIIFSPFDTKTENTRETTNETMMKKRVYSGCTPVETFLIHLSSLNTNSPRPPSAKRIILSTNQNTDDWLEAIKRNAVFLRDSHEYTMFKVPILSPCFALYSAEIDEGNTQNASPLSL
jgi:hypothetical protein